ncbi:unnamed protein product [Plutella xylostella]|uniref:(diamondback moth) hypothetical protein n=1 Tax=Plutella xylostella TaxID=51655 RepID=A0A8S4FQY2_PLUXY|nr:unnamed protein product [Plutella xylostella]
MSDLIQPQIYDSCKLAIPNGLKELMADISREVLRAQPIDIHKFIADYLSTLLVTRENLTVASSICEHMYKNIPTSELVDELKAIGFDDETSAKAADVIIKFFDNGGTREDALLPKLMKIMNIEEDNLTDVRTAIENTFIRQQIKNKLNIESESIPDEELDEITRAVQNTMKLYEQTEPTQQQYEVMATKIQAAYRGYFIRRQLTRQPTTNQPSSDASDFYTPPNSFDTSSTSIPELGPMVNKLSESGETINSQTKYSLKKPNAQTRVVFNEESLNNKIKTTFKSPINFELQESKNPRHIFITTPERNKSVDNDHTLIKDEIDEEDDNKKDFKKLSLTLNGNAEKLSVIYNEYESKEIGEIRESVDSKTAEKGGQNNVLQYQSSIQETISEEQFHALRPLSREISHYVL